MKRQQVIFAIAALIMTLNSAVQAQAQNAPKTWITSHQAVNNGKGVPTDPTNTPVERGFITVNAEPALGGFKVGVEIFQSAQGKGGAVTLSLQVVITTDKGTYVVPVMLLEKDTVTPNSFYTKREYTISYQTLQDHFANLAPGAPQLKIEPGLAMFVKADFGTSHDWGGPLRGGGFFLPTPMDGNGRLMTELNKPKSDPKLVAAPQARPTALDLGYKIAPEMTNVFNDRTTGAGLKPGGEIRSRVEGEGKFQLSDVEFASAKQKLFALANDPVLASQVLGAGWTIHLEDRYMQRDQNKQLILGADGLPIPDPMVDTYYDNEKYSAASSDAALRYRWTEGNQTGAWNVKPEGGRTDAQGIVYRREYGIDATDDKPQTIAPFADSLHPLNPFRFLRDVMPGVKPSDLLARPAVRLDDTRYKFKLEHTSKLAIEISADDVTAKDLRHGQPEARYHQIEMDIEHLANNSANTVNGHAGGLQYLPYNSSGNGGRWSDDSQASSARTSFLKQLDGKAFFDGRPVMHDESDLEANGALLMAKKADFDMAAQVITAVRDHAIGPNWRPGAQKYAYAAALLGLVPKTQLSKSVKRVEQSNLEPDIAARKAGHGACSAVFNGLAAFTK